MKKITTLLLCSILLITTTSATSPPKNPNPFVKLKRVHVTSPNNKKQIWAYDVAYQAIYNGTGYEVTLYFLEVNSPSSFYAVPAPVAITVNGTISGYTGSIIIPQGSSSYFVGTFPSVSGGITSVSPTSIGGVPVYHDQPPGW